MIVGFTLAADRDLVEIGDAIRCDDPIRAASFIDEILDRCWSLSVFHDRFPVALHRRQRTVRKMTHGNYIVFYRIVTARVEIIRVLHAKRNWRMIIR